MKRRWQVLVILMVVGGWGLTFGGSARASISIFWTVCSSGCSFTTLQAAINDVAVQNGDGIAIADVGNHAGFVDAAKSLTIEGDAPGPVTITSPAGPPVITVGQSGAATEPTVTIQNVTVSGGRNTGAGGFLYGGGILNYGALTLTNSTVTGNSAPGDPGVDLGLGGGIYNLGTLTLTGSTVSNNVAGEENVNGGQGAGIYSASGSGPLTVTNSTISSNTAATWDSFGGTGGGIDSQSISTLIVSGSTVSGNRAENSPQYAYGDLGGGILHDSGPTSVTNSTVSDNFGQGVTSSGALTVTNSTVNHNSGDGIYAYDGGGVTLTASTVTNNYGSGISNQGGTATVSTSTINYNNDGSGSGGSGSGGGIDNNGGTLTVSNSTIGGNSAGGGGGIENGSSGSLTVTNSTIGENSAGFGGGIDNGGTLTLINSTISGNAYEGIDNEVTGDHTSLANTIVAANTPTDCSGSLSDAPAGHNLLGTNSGCPGLSVFKGDVINVANPGIARLADNGGPTQTMLLYSGSPAINAGDDATCAASPINGVDQRGVARPLGSHCDIGAVEFAFPIAQGWNLIDLPSQTGITSASGLVSSLTSSTPTGAGGIGVVATYAGGRFSLYVPGYSADLPLQPTQGIFVLSKGGGTWLPGGPDYASSQTITLQPGWNLVAAPLPQPGLDASTIATEVAPPGDVQEIAAYTNGSYQTYLPNVGGSLTVPCTTGMWIQIIQATTWTPQ